MLEQPPNVLQNGQFLFMYFVLQTFDGQNKKQWVGNAYDTVVSECLQVVMSIEIFKFFGFCFLLHSLKNSFYWFISMHFKPHFKIYLN